MSAMADETVPRKPTQYPCTAYFLQLPQQGSDDCGGGVWLPQKKVAVSALNFARIKFSVRITAWGNDGTVVQEDNNNGLGCNNFRMTMSWIYWLSAWCSACDWGFGLKWGTNQAPTDWPISCNKSIVIDCCLIGTKNCTHMALLE